VNNYIYISLRDIVLYWYWFVCIVGLCCWIYSATLFSWQMWVPYEWSGWRPVSPVYTLDKCDSFVVSIAGTCFHVTVSKCISRARFLVEFFSWHLCFVQVSTVLLWCEHVIKYHNCVVIMIELSQCRSVTVTILVPYAMYHFLMSDSPALQKTASELWWLSSELFCAVLCTTVVHNDMHTHVNSS